MRCVVTSHVNMFILQMDELCHWHQEQWLEKVKERLIVASENEGS